MSWPMHIMATETLRFICWKTVGIVPTDQALKLAQEADRLRYALDEIGAVDPTPGEDAELAATVNGYKRLAGFDPATLNARESWSVTASPTPGPRPAA